MDNSQKYLLISVYAVEDNSVDGTMLKMREIPLVGDTVVMLNKGIFKVVERGQIADDTKLACGWVRLKNVEDSNHAPGSDNYLFLEKLHKANS